MKKAFIFYTDMDGVLNLFEKDKHARINMWNPGYYIDLPVREGISDYMYSYYPSILLDDKESNFKIVKNLNIA